MRVCLSVFYCTVLFVSISQVTGCEDRLRKDIFCVEWGVKLYSNRPTKPVYHTEHPRGVCVQHCGRYIVRRAGPSAVAAADTCSYNRAAAGDIFSAEND